MLYASYPVDTASLSVTGTACALDCAHCGGHYLQHMIPVEEARSLSEEELEDRLVVGKLVERRRSELTDNLRRLNQDRRQALLADLEREEHRQDTSAMETGR